jgi:M6 family metalloprotease-like protein
MFLDRFRAAGLALGVFLGCLAVAPPARALIVWDGKVVDAWPDLPDGANIGEGFAAAPGSIGIFPHPNGVVLGLTILVDFSDQAPAFTKDQIDAWLNMRGYNLDGLNGSVRDYYWDNSNGVVDFQNEIHGFYRAKNPKSYYEGGSGYARSDELWNEIITALDPEIDFSKFDNDKDGKTEAISIVYAGEAVTFAQGLWPHASGSNVKKDGVTLNRYMMTALSKKLGLYTFCHESGHMLFGWPDLYGFGNYCIMGNSSSQTNPVGINDVFRADQGWIPIVDVDDTTNAIGKISPNGPGFRYLNPSNPKESFFWSNVRKTGRWSTLRGEGLLMLHFDNTIKTNTPPNTLELAVVQADAKNDLGSTMWPMPGSDPGDFFQGAGNKEFSDKTSPNAHWNDDSVSGLRVYEISAIGNEMTFKIGNGVPDGTVLGGGTVMIDGGTPARDGGGVGAASAEGGAAGGSASGGAGGAPGAGGSNGELDAGPTSPSMTKHVDPGASPSTSGNDVEAGCSCRQTSAHHRPIGPAMFMAAALATATRLMRRRTTRKAAAPAI